MKYYTLVIRENNNWVIEFGDYDRKTVKAEMECLACRKGDMRIVTSGDTQAEINAAIAAL